MHNFLISNLISPVSGEELKISKSFLTDSRNNTFPIIDDCPILINENNSIFKLKYSHKPKGQKKRNLKDIIIEFFNRTKPKLTLNNVSKKNYELIKNDITKINTPKILIVGSGNKDGWGLDSKRINADALIVKTDVTYSNYVDVVCDAHNLPFKSNIFDLVIVQAVLEHVVDPKSCVKEIHRVLKIKGLIYSETPFIQQVHLGRYDFTRFTHLGHRRLFNNFSEIKSGPVCGPATALTWTIKYFLRSFFKPSIFQYIFEWGSSFFYFWLKYFDYYLIKKDGAFDSASAYFFYGSKQLSEVLDSEIIKGYKGNTSP